MIFSARARGFAALPSLYIAASAMGLPFLSVNTNVPDVAEIDAPAIIKFCFFASERPYAKWPSIAVSQDCGSCVKRPSAPRCTGARSIEWRL